MLLQYLCKDNKYFIFFHYNSCGIKINQYLCIAFETNDASEMKSWRDGRVVDRGGLENRCTERYRGFESLSLRDKREYDYSLFYFLIEY